MATRKDGAVLRQLNTLFTIGATRELTDGQLLKRFSTGQGEISELAFEALETLTEWDFREGEAPSELGNAARMEPRRPAAIVSHYLKSRLQQLGRLLLFISFPRLRLLSSIATWL